jgi:hypothetical protein
VFFDSTAFWIPAFAGMTKKGYAVGRRNDGEEFIR